jgi:hypothetical protein
VKITKKQIQEATGSGGTGRYKVPLNMAPQTWNKGTMEPFDIPVSKFVNPELAYDSYDGSMDDYSKNEINKLEKKAIKMAKIAKDNFSQNDEGGNPFNGYIPQGTIEPGTPKYIEKDAHLPKWNFEPVLKENLADWFVTKKINEASSTNTTSGPYTGPVEIGLKKWNKSELSPYVNFSTHSSNEKKSQKTLKNNVPKTVGVWEKDEDGNYDMPTHDVHTINEDLAVWFGTKKKPKGSKQPKGPWVNICRRDENGKHPPCGRPDTSKGGYPKCRAAGVSGKMSDSQKRAACSQKRKAEKKDTQSGKGQKPVMTSYKPKKSKNEGMRQSIKSILQEQVRKSNMLELGTLFESREVKNLKEAKKIAQQHLNENPRYYCVLHRIGLIEGADATNLARKTCPSI